MPEQTPQSKAYGNATTRLRNRYDAEFREYLAQEYEQLGLAYAPRPSAKEREAAKERAAMDRAADKVAALVEQYGPQVLRHPALRPYVGTSHPYGMGTNVAGTTGNASLAEG